MPLYSVNMNARLGRRQRLKLRLSTKLPKLHHRRPRSP